MENYVDYLRCGEIYKSPSHSNKTPYILKCFQCADIFLLLESFIFHIEDYCQPVCPNHLVKAETDDSVMEESKTPPNFKSQEEVQNNEILVIDDDDLVIVKNEPLLDVDYEENMRDGQSSSDNDVEILGKKSNMDDAEEANDNALEDDLYEIIVKDGDSEGDDVTSGDKSMSAFVSDFMESATNVTELISAYKKQPQLWDKRTHVGLKEHDQHCLEKLTEEFNSKRHSNITFQQVSAIISLIHRKYKEDLKCLRDNGGASNYQPSWYFEHLNFLEPFIPSLNIEKVYQTQPKLLQEQISQILEIYKGFPHLWDTNLAENCCNNKRQEALFKMHRVVETKVHLNVTQHSLERCLRNIHHYFGKVKKQQFNKNDVGGYIPQYYNQMLFLSEHVGPFKCLDCDLELKTAFMLKIHNFGIHGGSLPFTCSVCSKQFRGTNSYVSHAKRHMRDGIIDCNQYYCSDCSRFFNVKGDFKKHLKTHRVNACNICGIRFKTAATLNSHTAAIHAIPSNTYTCTVCWKVYKMKTKYNQHMKTHENKLK